MDLSLLKKWPSGQYALDEIEEIIEARGVRFVRIEVPDLHGISRSKTVPATRFRDVAESGLNFPLPPLALDVQCGAVQGTGYLEERGYSDVRLAPDLSTFAVLPHSDGSARVIADPHHWPDGQAVAAASRTVAANVFKKASALGFDVSNGFEYEFYILDPVTLEPAGAEVRQFASFSPPDQQLAYAIADASTALGLEVTTFNLEYGPGQIELNFAPAFGLAAADQAYTFKNVVKEVAAQNGRLASFMTKPSITASANGLHYNVSLWRDGKNLFHDASAPDSLSVIARQFVAGQIAHAPALAALFAPTINCAKRFRAHSFAPFEADWGIANRTVALRVKNEGRDDVHVENRIGAGAANPYLAAAAGIAAGLDGIERALEPPPPRAPGDETTRFAPLPATLEAALQALEEDRVLANSLGSEFVKVYATVKRHEIAKARRAIPDFDDAAFRDRIDPWERRELATVI